MDLLKIKKGIRRWAAIYLGAVSCILIPLFMRHGYYSLIYWKSRAYLYAAIPAVAVVAVGNHVLTYMRRSLLLQLWL